MLIISSSGRFASDGAQITPRSWRTEGASLWVQCPHTMRDEAAVRHCQHAKRQDALLLRLLLGRQPVEAPTSRPSRTSC